MTLMTSPALAADRHTRTNPAWQVLAELLKIRTTSAWRWFLLALILLPGRHWYATASPTTTRCTRRWIG